MRPPVPVLRCAVGLGFLAATLWAWAETPPDLWLLARRAASVHRFSTLFTAHDVRQHLGAEAGRQRALEWCRQTGITKVYLEVFRDGYQAERADLLRAREHFEQAGIEVSGCVTTTRVGKNSNRWNIIACYTDARTQERTREIFEYAASLFDETMIDDFWFTDCTCEACDAARRARTVTIGGRSYPVPGDTWEDYRRALMVNLSREYVLAAGRRVNPRATFILKYPQWYDQFHERGYDVALQTADFDRIWVGTETRDYHDPRWGGTVQYEAYFIMRWLGGLGGPKCGGGWYDPYGTTPATYVEQARQTILGGARESLLFCYGSLQRDTGPTNVATLRRHLPELFDVAGALRRLTPIGLAAYKPANSHPEQEPRVFDFVGMLGLPLVPCHEFPERARAAFFSVHALRDPQFAERFSRLVRARRPVLITDGLAARLGDLPAVRAPNVHILPVRGEPKSLLTLGQAQLDALRRPLLRPFRTDFRAPNGVALYLFNGRRWVVENFTDSPVTVELNGRPLEIPARDWRYTLR